MTIINIDKGKIKKKLELMNIFLKAMHFKFIKIIIKKIKKGLMKNNILNDYKIKIKIYSRNLAV